MDRWYKTEYKIVVVSKEKLDAELTLGELAVLMETEELCGDVIKKKVYSISCSRAKEIADSLGKDSSWISSEDEDSDE